MKIDKESSERFMALRFPLIIGVIFIHSNGKEVGLACGPVGLTTPCHFVEFIQNLISRGIAEISVPLFFLMSGYFFYIGFSGSLASYIEKFRSRIRTLFFPFVFWNSLTLLLFAFVQYFPATQVYLSGRNAPISTFGIYEYADAMIGIDGPPISYQFWFIRDLLALVLLTPAIFWVIKRIPKFALMAVLFFWFVDVWPLDVPRAEAFAFFYTGAFLACSDINPFVTDTFAVSFLSAYLPVLLLDALTKGHVLNRYIHHTGILLGIASALYLTKGVLRLTHVKRALLWAGRGSFFVFAVHEPLLLVIRKLAYKMVAPASGATVLILYFGVSSFVVLLCVLLYAGMKSFAPKVLDFVSGGRR